MADLPVAEGGRPGAKGGGVNWVMIGGIAGVGALVLMFMSKNGGAQGTTAAGTSINAALGSIQEQNLNIMGLVGQAEQNLLAQLGAVNENVIAGNGAVMEQSGLATTLNYYLQAYYYGQQQYAQTGNAAWNTWSQQFLDAISNESYAGAVTGNPPNWSSLPFPGENAASTANDTYMDIWMGLPEEFRWSVGGARS